MVAKAEAKKKRPERRLLLRPAALFSPGVCHVGWAPLRWLCVVADLASRCAANVPVAAEHRAVVVLRRGMGITLVRTVSPLSGHLFEVGLTPRAWWEIQKIAFNVSPRISPPVSCIDTIRITDTVSIRITYRAIPRVIVSGVRRTPKKKLNSIRGPFQKNA